MSDIIRLLPDHIANQIAAGEVIQRPASVVKELVENAIDSGATQIEVHIKDAGKTLIQVIDNGCGMSEMDARMAFERHATSKLASAEDLFALKTKGFRGEALASIASISHVKLTTRQADKEWGNTVVIEGSTIVEQHPDTSKIGTSFSIKNLFFNVPARRNFLKSDAVEFGHIEDEFLRVVLAHPSIQFILTNNDQVCYHLENSNLRKRIVDVFGRTYNDRLVPINEQTGIVKIEGFIGKPEFSKKSRGEQFFFVNDRFFKDSFFNHALVKAYDNLLAPRTFPSYFIFFTIDPSEIDVNVHPTKTEIKFENEKEIYAILKSSVRQSLGKFNVAPTLDFEQEQSFDLPWDMHKKPVVEPVIQVNTNYNPFQSDTSKPTQAAKSFSGLSPAIKQAAFGNTEITQKDWDAFYNLNDLKSDELIEENPPQEELSFNEKIETKKQYIFQADYILTPVKSGVLAVHMRRAKERILYDEIMGNFMHTPITTQQLLFPLEIATTKKVSALWNENNKTLERLGFNWEILENQLNFIGLPSYLNIDQANACIDSISAKLEFESIDKGELAHEFILAIARSASLQKLNMNNENATNLIESLFLCIEHQYSPSGKLILKTLTNEELFKNF